MPRIEGRATIDRPPEEVFAFVADAKNDLKWHDHVPETRWLDDRETGPGRRGRQAGLLFGRHWGFVAEVVDWDPPRLVSWQVIEGYPVRTTIRVEPAKGSSVMTLTVETPPLLGKRVDPLLSRFLEWMTAARGRSDIVRLQAILEGSPTGS
jgi:uncharacterized membrane protein